MIKLPALSDSKNGNEVQDVGKDFVHLEPSDVKPAMPDSMIPRGAIRSSSKSPTKSPMRAGSRSPTKSPQSLRNSPMMKTIMKKQKLTPTPDITELSMENSQKDIDAATNAWAISAGIQSPQKRRRSLKEVKARIDTGLQVKTLSEVQVYQKMQDESIAFDNDRFNDALEKGLEQDARRKLIAERERAENIKWHSLSPSNIVKFAKKEVPDYDSPDFKKYFTQPRGGYFQKHYGQGTGTLDNPIDMEEFNSEYYRLRFRSFATYCEVKMTEIMKDRQVRPDGSHEPDVGRTKNCIAILNKMIETFSSYTKILAPMRDEIERSIYSDYFEKSNRKHITNSDDDHMFEQLPYFEVVKKLERALESEQELNKDLKTSLVEEIARRERADERYEALRKEWAERKGMLEGRIATIRAENDMIRTIEGQLRAEIADRDLHIERLRGQEMEMRSQVAKARDSILRDTVRAQTHASEMEDRLLAMKRDYAQLHGERDALEKQVVVYRKELVGLVPETLLDEREHEIDKLKVDIRRAMFREHKVKKKLEFESRWRRYYQAEHAKLKEMAPETLTPRPAWNSVVEFVPALSKDIQKGSSSDQLVSRLMMMNEKLSDALKVALKPQKQEESDDETEQLEVVAEDVARVDDLDQVNAEGRHMIHVSAMDDDVRMVKACLLAGVPVDHDDIELHSALHYASAGGNVTLIRMLLRAGANIHKRNEDGYSPVLMAARAGHVEAVQYLMRKGADIRDKEAGNMNALALARHHKHHALADTLDRIIKNISDGETMNTMTPRPEWDAIGRQLPTLYVGAGCRTKTVVDDMVAELVRYVKMDMSTGQLDWNAYKPGEEEVQKKINRAERIEKEVQQKLFGGPDFFTGMGMGNSVPVFLRFKGQVRNRRTSRRELQSFLREFWKDKKAYDKKTGRKDSVGSYFNLYLSKMYGFDGVIAEYAYGLLDACRRYSYEADGRLFLGCINGEFPEDVVWDLEYLVEFLGKQLHMAEQDAWSQKTRKEADDLKGLVPKKDFIQVLTKMFSAKTPNEFADLMEIVVMLDAEKKVPGEGWCVNLSRLLDDTREGLRTEFVETIRNQYIRMREDMIFSIRDYLVENDHGTMMVNPAKAKASILHVDPKKPMGEVDDYVERGWGGQMIMENKGKKWKEEQFLPITTFIKNIANGLVHRSTSQLNKEIAKGLISDSKFLSAFKSTTDNAIPEGLSEDEGGMSDRRRSVDLGSAAPRRQSRTPSFNQ